MHAPRDGGERAVGDKIQDEDKVLQIFVKCSSNLADTSKELNAVVKSNEAVVAGIRQNIAAVHHVHPRR